MPASSYLDLARVMLALPATAVEVAQRVGMTERSTRLILRRLWAVKLVHPGATREVGKHRNITAVWLPGDGKAAPGLFTSRAVALRSNLIAFATLWRALQEGSTAHDLGDDNGLSHVSVYRMLKYLRERKQVHIGGFMRDALGRPVAIWVLGEGANAPRPRAQNATVKSRLYRERKRLKALTMLGAAA